MKLRSRSSSFLLSRSLRSLRPRKFVVVEDLTLAGVVDAPGLLDVGRDADRLVTGLDRVCQQHLGERRLADPGTAGDDTDAL
jgi:hypothetical protein